MLVQSGFSRTLDEFLGFFRKLAQLRATIPTRMAQFVADQQVRALQLLQEAFELVLLLGFFEMVYQPRGREEADPPPLAARRQAQGNGKMRLPGSRIPDQADIVFLLDPLRIGQFQDLGLGKKKGRKRGRGSLPDNDTQEMRCGLFSL
jgi:hypothetical protein